MPQEDDEDYHIKRMADLLLQGSAITELACPACASPLFRLRSKDLWCARCEKKVIVVTKEEDLVKIQSSTAFEALETMLLAKIQEIQSRMQHEESAHQLQKLGAALSELLDDLEKVRKSHKS